MRDANTSTAQNFFPTNSNIKITGFSEFVSLLQSKLKCGHWLFRGLKNSKYPLIPTLGRSAKPEQSEFYKYEMTMLRKTLAGTVDQDTATHSDIN